MSTESMQTDYDVIIVGGGPVGLSAAIELTSRGHRVCVIEQNPRVGVQPRAKTTNVRSMTHMRRWGLAPKVRQRAPLRSGFARRVRFATGLFGHDLFNFENAFCASPIRDDRYPENAEFIPQYVVENILLERVLSEPLAKVLMHTRLQSFQQTADGQVVARVSSTDAPESLALRSRYLIGADGGRSTVREHLGIQMEGQAGLIAFVTLILRIKGLNAQPDLRDALFHWIVRPDAPCVLGPLDKEDVWYWQMPQPLGQETPNEDLLEVVRKAIGREFDIEILARDPWTVHKFLAERYRVGNVFLAGDACHLHSPFGGHGMNLGIGDAIDLGWKLSGVLQGWATDALLDTYEVERRSVHHKVLETSTENVASLSDHFLAPALDEDTPDGEKARAKAGAAIEAAKTPEFRSLGVVLGYRYESPSVAKEDGAMPPAFSVTNYKPSAYPGSLAPHAWMPDGTSLYDHFGQGFTLLRLGAPQHQAEADLIAYASEGGLPLKVFAPENAPIRTLYGADYALVRPDQHIAWRGDQLRQASDFLARAVGFSSVPEKV